MCRLQEGKQASLAADFSITQFKHLGRLLMVHGRNSYKRSAALSQFVIHRSLCISTMQVRCGRYLPESPLHTCTQTNAAQVGGSWYPSHRCGTQVGKKLAPLTGAGGHTVQVGGSWHLSQVQTGTLSGIHVGTLPRLG